MPKDNHSTMQLYLDGFNNNFFTFFYVSEKNNNKNLNKSILEEKNYLKNKTIQEIKFYQKLAMKDMIRQTEYEEIQTEVLFTLRKKSKS